MRGHQTWNHRLGGLAQLRYARKGGGRSESRLLDGGPYQELPVQSWNEIPQWAPDEVGQWRAFEPSPNDLASHRLHGKPVADEIQEAAGPRTGAGHNGIGQDRFAANVDTPQAILTQNEVDRLDVLKDLGTTGTRPRSQRDSD